jgi:hypothetical protein
LVILAKNKTIMKKIFFIGLFLLAGFTGFSQEVSLKSVHESMDYATLKMYFDGNAPENFTVEVANHECGVSDSEYLKTPRSYSSSSEGFSVGSEGEVIFNTPFSLGDLQSKWFKWRVVVNGQASNWECFSWSDYCEDLLTEDGNCK